LRILACLLRFVFIRRLTTRRGNAKPRFIYNAIPGIQSISVTVIASPNASSYSLLNSGSAEKE